MPLKYSGTLEITTRIGCSVNCVYCPQKQLVKRYREMSDIADKPIIMSLDTFKKCIDKVPKDTRIDFSGMAEPWLNNECTKMVEYAHVQGYSIAVYTTLIGMTMNDWNILKDIPMDELVLHIPDDKSNSHINVTPEYIALLQEVVHAKKNGVSIVSGYSCHAGIHPDIAAAIPKDGKLITEMLDRAGNLDNEYVEHHNPKGEILCINCEAGINHNVLLPDGSVALCCMDYGLEHILGNLLTESWEDIHNSKEAEKIRSGLKDDTIDTLCRRCSNAKNITEVYSEYMVYKDWTNNLLESQKSQNADLQVYKDWVSKLQIQKEETDREIAKYIRDAKVLTENLDTLYNENHKLQTEPEKLRKECDAAYSELNAIKASKAYKILTMYKRIKRGK